MTGSNQSQIGFLGSIRAFSSHDDHLSKQEVVDRVLDVVKCFPKVDPAKVSFDLRLIHLNNGSVDDLLLLLVDSYLL